MKFPHIAWTDGSAEEGRGGREGEGAPRTGTKRHILNLFFRITPSETERTLARKRKKERESEREKGREDEETGRGRKQAMKGRRRKTERERERERESGRNK